MPGIPNTYIEADFRGHKAPPGKYTLRLSPRQLETLYCPEMDAWDKDMIQRKSQAYDDVENFVNKFSAEYLFLLNQTGGSDIPKVNKGSKNRRAELDPQWEVLKARATQLIENSIPNFNKKLWEAGIGAVRM
ncbi:hypothetical protein GQR58_026417 [Nymphon striatum]|nr:hypothetical protein GQR58_026417 [Nymphon striatum]